MKYLQNRKEDGTDIAFMNQRKTAEFKKKMENHMKHLRDLNKKKDENLLHLRDLNKQKDENLLHLRDINKRKDDDIDHLRKIIQEIHESSTWKLIRKFDFIKKD